MIPTPRPLLLELHALLLAEGLKETRDPERAQRLNRLWREVGEVLEGELSR